jgi:hypothetical protein
MTCPKKRQNQNSNPLITSSMKKKKQIYSWKSIKSNPNIYCWIPTSKKNSIPESLSINDVNVQDVPQAPVGKNFKETIKELKTSAEKYTTIQQKKISKSGDDIVSYDDPAKYRIVRKFISDKGLKLYGGAAINMYLPRKEKIYSSSSIPDYDFFSPDPWNDAVKLAQLLYDAGYKYTEVKGGIHKGTYKVYSDMWPVADITYMPEDDFNHIKTRTIQGMKIIKPEQLMIDIYKQLFNISKNHRWEKVASRQVLLEKWIKPLGKKFKCSENIFMSKDDTLSPSHITMLEQAYTFIKKRKLIYSGSLAYNTLVQVAGGKNRLFVDHYEVLSEDANQDAQDFFHTLISQGMSEEELNITTHHLTYKAVNNTFYSVSCNEGIICSFTQITLCSPYTYISGRYIVAIDYIKYDFYIDIVFNRDKNQVKDTKCKVRYINSLQNKYYKKNKVNQFDKGPFQRFKMKCKGDISNGLKTTILQRWVDSVETRESVKTIKPKSDSILLNNVKGKTIRIYPSSDIPEECDNKNKENCKYPCVYNDDKNKCFGERIGGYKVGVSDFEMVEENIYETANMSYPEYG